MSKVKSFQLIMIAMVILIFFPLIGQSKVKDMDNLKAPDVISIDLPAPPSSNEMPSVDFLHALHNEAADGKCAECHLEKEGTFVFKFKRTDTAPTMELYHDNCISCHIKTGDAGKKSGPLAAECRSCHGRELAPAQTAWKKITFDKSLHALHEQSKDIKPLDTSHTDNCSACHHKFNTKTKQTYYVQGEEESCAYCHKATDADDIRAIRHASHDSCVACHVRLRNQEVAAGPISCKGCHEAGEQAKIKVVKDIPRMKRNQPDEAFMAGMASKSDTPKYLMNPVAFNHKRHETTVESCKACHHDTLKKCSECHTPKGDDNGKFVRLEQAMHMGGKSQSCIGCHDNMTRNADCAGCHDLMPKGRMDDDSCVTCHNIENNRVVIDEKIQKASAKRTVAMRSGKYTRVKTDQIPETVVIGELANEYKPSEFPHRKVVQAIAKRMEKSELANTFHKDQLTTCTGCHHNSPKSLEPPKCASCHGKTTELDSGKPHLKGAYHGQCITCHEQMEVKEVLGTDCIKCHEKK